MARLERAHPNDVLVALALLMGASLACAREGGKGGAGAAPAASASALASSGSMSAASGRVVEITAGDKGFLPSSVDVARGEKVLLRFKRTSESDCFAGVVFPDLGIRQAMPVGGSVDIPIPTDAEGKVLYECNMGMFRGRVVVVAR